MVLFMLFFLFGFLLCWGSFIGIVGDLEFCGIMSVGLGGVVCLDNDIFVNFNDDWFIFFLNFFGSNLGSGYMVFFVLGGIFLFMVVYGFFNGFVIDFDDFIVLIY